MALVEGGGIDFDTREDGFCAVGLVGGEGYGEVLFDPILDSAGEDCGLAFVVIDGGGPDFIFGNFADPVGDRVH